MFDRASHEVTRVHEITTLCVRTLRRIQRVDDGNFVHLLRHLGKVLRDLDAADVRAERFDGALRFFARLYVEGIQMAHPTAHVQVDHLLGGSCR